MAAEMESILRKLKLDYLIERFNIEKITPNLVGKLSLNEFKKLGVQNRNDIMVVRMECSKYGSNKQPRSRSTRNECGAPMFEIPRSVLECYLEQNLKIEEISKILSVSESTIYRRMRQYHLSKMEFSTVTEDELDRVVSEITKEFPHSGEGLIKQMLLGKI
ncbi:tRNA (uracil-O(2)-)-methyltransferase [Paramuricea clavata]|uniref:tRNA (Uracil-O(2)-)-methyltransferase n=1 Tax=Paramuricea clavata TaxID=317549 RepID=A0A7D9HCD8_PARCT|nr:tRNA (uracil-O(2)-)-methyltransferase [Paramuricea clavata]